MTRKISPTYNLAVMFPELASEWSSRNSLDAKDVYPKSGKVFWWVCALGHNWQAVVRHRANGTGCPVCAGKVVLPGFNDILTTDPLIAQEWSISNTTLPSEVSRGSHTKFLWACSQGHEWVALISNRLKGNGCPYCSGYSVIPGINDTESLFPHLVEELESNVDLRLTAPQSHVKLDWNCSSGHRWSALLGNRTRGTGCPSCVDVHNPLVVDVISSLFEESRVNFRLSDLKWMNGVHFEVDIYTKNGLVIEYDGSWHKSKLDVDTTKTNMLLDSGYSVVRIRQSGLDWLPIIHKNLTQVRFRWSDDPAVWADRLRPLGILASQ